jgi:AcrR family transcriptional regulator
MGVDAITDATADQDRKAPGRPRSARADEAIIAATLDLLASGTPVEALSIEAVAARAGVGKATIYRRWANKESLIVDAVASIKGDVLPIPGISVREDLVTLLRPVGRMSQNRFGRIMPCLLNELRRNPQLAQSYRELTEPRREALRQVLRRGIATGEVRPELDIEVAVTMLVAPLIVQNVLAPNPALEGVDLPAKLVDTLLAGQGPTPLSGPATEAGLPSGPTTGTGLPPGPTTTAGAGPAAAAG